MNNRAAQNELCRSTKFPDELYRIALSYKRGDKYAKSHVSTTTGGVTSSAPTGVGLQTKTKSVGIIPGVYRKNHSRDKGQHPGCGFPRGNTTSRRCYNCDQPGFTPDHVAKCSVKSVTCNYCRKTGYYKRTYRGKQASNRGCGAGKLIWEHEKGTFDYSEIPEDHTSQHGSSVGCVNRSEASSHSWDSDSSGNLLGDVSSV